MPVVVITQKQIYECSIKILKELQDRKDKYAYIHIYIYEMMVDRRTKKQTELLWENYYKQFQSDYQNKINRIKLISPGKISESSWLNFSFDFEHNFKQESVGDFKINFKEYFSFVPKSKDYLAAYKEILNFINIIPLIHRDLYNIGQKEKEKIAFKIPVSLYQFINHVDTLVVYYCKKKTGKNIRKKILDLTKKAGIQMIRELRAESGFDFMFSKEKRGISHSQIVATVVARWINKYKKEIINKYIRVDGAKITYNFEEFSKWLINIIKEVSSQDSNWIYNHSKKENFKFF